ncbi:MAG: protein kinase [Verrucomicrobiota bacterium]
MSGRENRFTVLIFTDIVGSTDLKVRHGVPAFSEALQTHNSHFERLARECRNITVLQNMGDGYFAEAGGVAEALRFALLFQEAMREGPWHEVRLATRVGIHAGEVSTVDSEGGSGIVAPAADLAARVMSLAVGGQILLTRFPFDEARHFIREHPAVSGKSMPPLGWLAHGPYLMKGRDEPVEIFEIGAEGLAPLVAPPDGEKAKRAIRPGEEETLGWRPAIGLEIPGRPGWHLTGLLGAGGFGEVWAGEHAKLRQQRAFKFCFDDERLRALKREVTLVRLLQSALGQRDDIVHIHELKLDEPPFYLESDLASHGNLLQWAEKQGGLDKIPLARRIALVAHTATALAAAHSIGVLHKDIKPTNILIFDDPDGEPRPRLVDFGIGTLADPAVLGVHGVTAAGFTRPTIQHSTGTPTYSPPEYLAGRPYTIQGDIYGLGVLLYQLITCKPLDPLAVGWERDIADPLLREDIAACVDGDPARRLPSATELADRLLHLDLRREEIKGRESLARVEAARVAAVAAATAARQRTARFRKLAAAFAVLALLALASGLQAWVSQKRTAMALGEVEKKNREVELKIEENYDQIAEAARKAHGTARDAFAKSKAPRIGLAHLAEAVRYNAHLPKEKRLRVLHDDVIQRLLNLALVDPYAVGETIRHESVVKANFSPDGQRVVTVSKHETVRIWDAATGQPVGEPMLHGAYRVTSAHFSPDGRRVVTASYDKSARIWDVDTQHSVGKPMFHGNWVTSAHFSPDGQSIVTASDDYTARIWDVDTGQPVGEPMRHEDHVVSASFSRDGRRVATASKDRTARIWDVDTLQPVGNPMRHENVVINANFSPDGNYVVTASDDHTARIWDAATGQPVGEPMRHEDAVSNATFSPDGRRIVTASADQTSRIWDADTGQPVAKPMRHGDHVTSADFSPDGRRVVTASDDKTSRIWDADTGQPLGEPVRHRAAVTSANFSPDGRRVVTVSGDRVWLFSADIQFFAGTHVNPDDITFLAGTRINEDGEAVEISPDELTSRRTAILAQSSAKDDAWISLMRWRLSEPGSRTVSFRGTITASEHIEREITWAVSRLDATKRNPSILAEAYSLDPGDPLIHLALAAVEGNEDSRKLITNRGIKQLAAAEAAPNKAAHQAFAGTYLAKAAVILALQGDQTRAAKVFMDLLAKHDLQRQTWGASSWIEKLDDSEWPEVFRESLVLMQNADLRPSQPLSGDGQLTVDPLVGDWKWVEKQIVTFHPEGGVSSTLGNQGKWHVVCEGPLWRDYELNWNEGRFIDRIRLPAKGNKVKGTNHLGRSLTGTRLLQKSTSHASGAQEGTTPGDVAPTKPPNKKNEIERPRPRIVPAPQSGATQERDVTERPRRRKVLPP